MLDLDWRTFPILVVDDEEDNLDAFRFAFRKSFSLHYALGGAAALAMLDRLDAAVIVSDQRMPGMSGIEFLKRAKAIRPDTVGVLLTAYAELSVLIEAVNSGAVERYVQKPWDSKELTVILRQAISSFATVRENRRLREQLTHYAGYLEREQRDPLDFGEISCTSAAMKEVAARIEEVAPTPTHVLIVGEVGSEKEVVARALHVGSQREERPFVKVTCAAFPAEHLERELFGYRRGAFEGAFDDRAGRLELAHSGTLYLDEPGIPPKALQARLLRMHADGEVERIGATESTRVDVRIVVSVNAGFESMWTEQDLLPELSTRLGVFPIRLPALRERPEDIRGLAVHFLRKYGHRNVRAARSLSDEAMAKLESYAWPGNVRELENVIERAAILARGDVIQPEQLAFDPRLPSRSSSPPVSRVEPTQSALLPADSRPPKVDLNAQLDEIERRELIAALQRCGGNKAEVARSLGVQRTTLYYRLKRLGIEC
jgi:DNA-binding NtrC family response regulator